MMHHQRYIHAMGHRTLTPLYDPFVRAFLRERTLRSRLLDAVGLKPHQRLLDVGSGTGTFVLMAKRRCVHAEIAAIDGDAEIVRRARRKAAAAGLVIDFREVLATKLPFERESFDHVTSTFVMHHLTSFDKETAIGEAHRVLLRGGVLHVVDIGPQHGFFGQQMGKLLRNIGELADNLDGRLPGLITDVGFSELVESQRLLTAFGEVSFLHARK